jgi:Putative zinc-finger
VTDPAPCTPVSWLRLERRALGELAADERQEVDAHLSSCARCRACAELIAREADRALPPLPAADVARAPVPLPGLSRPRPWRWPRLFAFATAAAVVALVFVLRPGERAGGRRLTDGSRVVAVKGGDIAVELIRERDGSTAWEPTSFAPHDRFKLLVTCPPPLQVHADIVVLQDDGPAYPGEPALVRCGNRVPVPPAFRITGAGAATVCVGLDPSGPPSRPALARGDAAPGPHACVHLDRAR